MIEHETRRNLIEEDYRQQRKLAEKFSERNQHEKAAKYYQRSASKMERLANFEPSVGAENKRLEVAESLREAASVHRQKAEGDSSASNFTPSGDGSDTARPGSPSSGVSSSSESAENDETASENGDREIPAASAYLEDTPDVTFEDVGGMSDLKQELISKIVDPMERQSLYDEFGLTPASGFLLHGKPGTGKTYISRALAGRLGWNFLSIKPSTVSSSLVGEAADNIAELFAVAREHAPSLVFIDEIDSIAPERTGSTQNTQSEEMMLTQILTEMSEPNDNVVVIAACNHLDQVDDALLNPSRFSEVIEVPPPDAEAREAILRVHLRDRPVLTEQLDWKRIRRRTNGYTGADLEEVASEAAHNAVAETDERGELQPIAQRHLEEAIDEVEPSLDKMSGSE